MVPRWLQDGQRVCRGWGGDRSPSHIALSWISIIFSKKVAKIIDFYSIFETDPAFRLDENAARALKCVRGRKNERGPPRHRPTSPAFFFFLSRQDPLIASNVWGTKEIEQWTPGGPPGLPGGPPGTDPPEFPVAKTA